MVSDRTNHPCRLFVYLARDAPIGVILRRGPSDWVRLSTWRTDDDTFEHGQWMRARVYERRSDLSADGSLFVAFVRGAAGPRQGNTDSWVALSRPPYFSASALWFVGGTYYTGGYFPDASHLWLGWESPEPDQGELPNWLRMTNERPPFIDGTNDWTDRTVWINRMLRDGWVRRDGAEPEQWERPNLAGDMALTMRIVTSLDFRAFGGRYVIEYTLRSERNDEEIELGRATWADWDHRGRLILAREGRLLHWQSPEAIQVIADVNDQVPDPQPAPEG
jgi:hypothetical protein